MCCIEIYYKDNKNFPIIQILEKKTGKKCFIRL